MLAHMVYNLLWESMSVCGDFDVNFLESYIRAIGSLNFEMIV